MDFTCKELYDSITPYISDEVLQNLLTCRDNNEIDFSLIDIREVFEYTDLSIKGTDLLLPTSMIHMHMDKLEKLRDKLIVLYCRTGNRTGQMLHILDRMGFTKIAHLSDGIVRYSGEKLKNAPLPNKLN
ncbi:rhodanese-like domain-containing protein [Sulfurospirillum sp. 1307]